MIPLMNHTMEVVFENVENNKKAIASRGRNPLNIALLYHPELRETKNTAPDCNDPGTSVGNEVITITDEPVKKIWHGKFY